MEYHKLSKTAIDKKSLLQLWTRIPIAAKM